MSDIFLSYSSEDKARAQILAKALKSQGYSVWWDRFISPGKIYSKVIEQELEAANCVIVMWSRNSVTSTYVHSEASEGNSRGILIPVLIEKVKIPLEFKLIQAANLIDWKGEASNHDFSNLLESISNKVGLSPPKQNIQEKSSRINKPEPLDNIKSLGSIKQITNRHIKRIPPDGTRIQFRFKGRNYETCLDTVKYRYPTLNSIFTSKFHAQIDIWVALKELYFKDEDGWHPLNNLRG